jgi:ATP-dependent Clp protease ATP-binding subunit ClpA
MAKNRKAWSADVESMTQKSTLVARNYFQTWVGTPHIFISVVGFLNGKKASERYAETWTTLKTTLNNYGITGDKFKDEFLALMPAGVAPIEGEDFEIRYHEEGVRVFDKLTKLAIDQNRTAEMEDLVRELFSDKRYRLHAILESLIGSTQETDKLCDEIIEVFKAPVKREVQDLEKIKELTNLNRYVKEKNMTVVGADNAVKQIELALSGRSIPNAILVGAAGTGKTVSVYEFVKRINDGRVIKELKDKIVYQLDPAGLVAGTRYRGDFEEKLMTIINLVKANPNVILFIDEAHQMVKLGDSDGASSGGNIIKPFITRGELQMIWATTEDEYAKHIEKEKALARRFHKVNISEPSKEETREILEGILPDVEAHFNRKASKEIIEKVLNLSEKYTIDQANPAKAINMLELAFANSKVFNEEGEIVFTDDILESIKIKYDIEISEDKTDETIKELNSFLLGQEEPLKIVANNLRYIEKGLVDTEKPLVSMIFAGPTGVGKTETAKIIAKKFCGNEKYLIKVNMGEYSTEMDVTKITGAAPGYVGHDDQSGLVSQVKQYPNSVVLFDEIEKAHPKVFDTILNILDTGEMTDNHKNRVSFRNTIIIFTTNLGYDKDFAKSKGVGFLKTKTSAEDIREAVEDNFRPEFINRIDEIVTFNGLTVDIAETLIKRYVKDYETMMEIDYSVSLTKDDIEEIIEVADIEVFGARGLKRAVRKQLLKVLDRPVKKSRTKGFKSPVLSD